MADTSARAQAPAKSGRAEMAFPLAGVSRAVGAMLLWSSSGLLIDRLEGSYGLTVYQISAWRVLLVLPILAGVIAVRRPGAFRCEARDIPIYLAAGLVGVMLSNVTWATSVHLNRPAVAAALSFSAPAFIALGDRFLFGVHLRRVQLG